LSAHCFGILSERLCDDVHLNLAYRSFCRLGLDGEVPDHSTFLKNRHRRFRESDLLRQLFDTVMAPLNGRGSGRRRRLRRRRQPALRLRR
jgi:IS5 family transposase